jgi:hypothetical protein
MSPLADFFFFLSCSQHHNSDTTSPQRKRDSPETNERKMSNEEGNELILSQMRSDDGQKEVVDESVFELADSDSSDDEKTKLPEADAKRGSWKNAFGTLKQMVEKFESIPLSKRSQLPKVVDQAKKVDEEIEVEIFEYSPEQCKQTQIAYANIPAKSSPWATVRWIDIEGQKRKEKEEEGELIFLVLFFFLSWLFEERSVC